jgi:hypothetical protein
MTQTPSIIPYEQRLDQNLDWALREGSMHFEEHSAVHKTLTRIARKLDELGVPYAIADGMALFAHGYRRFTEDVDILVTREGARTIHEALEGLGYVPPFKGSKKLRDAELGVRIEFLIAGEYPGDGKPKPVRFPDPADVAVKIGDMKYLALPTLIDLKRASGMTNPRRAKDIVDVQELIEALDLPENLAQQIEPHGCRQVPGTLEDRAQQSAMTSCAYSSA